MADLLGAGVAKALLGKDVVNEGVKLKAQEFLPETKD